MNKFSLAVFLSFLLCFSLTGQENDIRITHAPYLQNMGETEVTIVWTTNKPSVGWVELLPDDGTDFYLKERPRYYNTKNGIKTTTQIHAVRLSGLKPGTYYRYRVYAQEVLKHVSNKVFYGNVAATTVYQVEPLRFKTNDYKKESVSFVMVNDIHNRDSVMEQLISHCEVKKTDLFLFNGDMVSIFNSEKQIFDGFMDKATQLFASEIPMYYTRGNHETRGVMAASFQDYFSPKEKNLYYLFRQGPVCFVVLDSGEDKPDSDIEYAGITDYDSYRTEQAQWLKEALNSPEYKEATFKVIVCHIPPFGGWHGEQEVADKFVPLLNEAAADVMLCGHLHKTIRKDASAEIRFPIIVNSNNSLLKGEVKGNSLEMRILDLQGKEVDRLIIRK